MRIVEVTYRVPGTFDRQQYVRDPEQVGSFIRGVECNEHGVADRNGCSEESFLMVRVDRVVEMVEVKVA